MYIPRQRFMPDQKGDLSFNQQTANCQLLSVELTVDKLL